MAFGLHRKIKHGILSLNKAANGIMSGLGAVGDAVDVVGGLASGLTSLIASKRPPKPDWGGPSETGDSFTRLMEKRSILPPWMLKK
jgi:hypothetical protein